MHLPRSIGAALQRRRRGDLAPIEASFDPKKPKPKRFVQKRLHGRGLPFSAAAAARIASGRRSRRPGLPARRPRALAALIPDLVRSAISARSSWATAPRTCRENIPCGADVSIGSRSDRKWTSRSSRSSMTSSRWLTDRAGRSSQTTTRTSPADSSFSTLVRTGRARSAGGV